MGSTSTRVLVVEGDSLDEESFLGELNKTTLGQNVRFLHDPRTVLELLQGSDSADFKRDLIAIILDIDLPLLDGMDLLKLIRAMDGMAMLPIILLASPRSAVRPELMGIAHLDKPLSFRSFSKAIADLFHRSGIANQLS